MSGDLNFARLRRRIPMTFWMGSAPRARNTAAMLSLTTALTASALVGITAFGPTEGQARITRIEIKRVE